MQVVETGTGRGTFKALPDMAFNVHVQEAQDAMPDRDGDGGDGHGERSRS